jgi:glycerate kinase
MQQIVIAADSFKGSLSSSEVAEAFAEGWHEIAPDCNIRKVRVADGGEGTLEALVEMLQGDYIELTVHDPLHRPIKARYGVVDGGTTAVIEMASASGLTLLASEERNPMVTSTYGTGEMVADALARGCRKVLLGIGGSATNECGVGMFRALGYRFLDRNGRELSGGGEILEQIAEIDDSQRIEGLDKCEFVVACDVTNPLYGEQGAAHIFAPQKGADRAMVEALDRGVQNFAEVVKRHNGADIAEMEGAGAAGGLGGGIMALLNSRLERGIELVLEAIRFDQIIEGSDLVITGEGKLDGQTVMGKAPKGILAAAQRQNIHVIAIGGAVEWCDELRDSGFDSIECVTPEGMDKKEAMTPAIAKENVRDTARRIAQRYR